MQKINIDVTSEIGKLNAVLIHTPGHEIENVTPENAERALYSDILNLSVASGEYNVFRAVLKKFSNVYEVRLLLQELIADVAAKDRLLKKICKNESIDCIKSDLAKLPDDVLASQLIEGVPIEKNTLTKFLSNERYQLQPLHNFFFTRDASVSINNEILISKMASVVRERESIIVESIFNDHPLFEGNTFNPIDSPGNISNVTIEGGDVLIARDNILVIGIGARTTTQGVDYIIEEFKRKKKTHHIIVQELPRTPESFIHLDMVFTFLDYDQCMIYEPVVLNKHSFETVHIEIDNGAVKAITECASIIDCLRKLKVDIEPIKCGGDNEEWVQEREQWHSGTNYFALAPGKVMGYGRNSYTTEALNKKGYEIINGSDVIKDNINIHEIEKCVITIDGAELSRGGGGCRCMTMPISREKLS
ncbi:MAG: hypothetical protein K9J12_13210 [Melioribacteraceae bacterium]|nr:hypothetical protein [Melioribacteraceae bacterium]MCF8263841.1 hypothetical protein [Melioribacteraceae bacterium]MCF8412522.1 hypothetical protein [Melioribacteraceae bacterium]MCF8432199.1 hypothetical protein [Melioribacteraceae bacterium]